MSNITFNNVELHLQEHTQHEFLLTNKEVAIGYGIKLDQLSQAKRNHPDALIEGKHWIKKVANTKGGKQNVIHWTKRGIVRLGFFIKSKEAKAFRDWAEDYIVNATQTTQPQANTKELQETIMKQNAIIAKFQNTLEDKNATDKLKHENTNLKRALIHFKDNYHSIVNGADNKIEAMRKELEKMTNRFQMLPNLANDGKNLNTDTVAKHSYWK